MFKSVQMTSKNISCVDVVECFKCTVHLEEYEDNCYLIIIIIKYCIAAIFVWVQVFELFLTFIILIFQVALCCNLANFYFFLHDISKNVYAFVFTFYLCHAKRGKNWLSYSTKLLEISKCIEHSPTLSNIMKQNMFLKQV